MVNPVMNKQNDHVVSLVSDVSEIHNVSTTKHPAYVMMLGVVASNWKKISPLCTLIQLTLRSLAMFNFL